MCFWTVLLLIEKTKTKKIEFSLRLDLSYLFKWTIFRVFRQNIKGNFTPPQFIHPSFVDIQYDSICIALSSQTLQTEQQSDGLFTYASFIVKFTEDELFSVPPDTFVANLL